MRTLTLITLCILCLNSSANDHDRADEKDGKLIVGQDFSIGSGEHVESVVAIGSKGTIAGTVDELVAIGSHIELQSTARIEKEMVSIGSDITRQPGALVTKESVGISAPFSKGFLKSFDNWNDSFESVPWWPGVLIWIFFVFLLTFSLGFLFLHLAPRFSEEVRQYLAGHSLAAFGAGVLGHLFIFPGLIILVITLIGIPLIPIYMGTILVLMLLGYICVAYCLGTSLLRGPSASSLKALALGLLVLGLIKLIPAVGLCLVYLAAVAGFGAVIRIAYARLSAR